MSDNKGYVIDANRAVYKIIGKEAIILETKTGYCYSLNEVGTTIWEAVSKGMDLNLIEQYLTNEYEVPNSVAKKDIKTYLERLRQESLLKYGSLPKPWKNQTIASPKKKKKYKTPEFDKYSEIRRGRSVA